MPFKIRTKLLIAFFATLVPFSLVFLANHLFFTKAVQKNIHISRDISYELETLGDLQLAIDRLLMPANDYIITADPRERVEFDRLAGEVEKHLALILMEKRCQWCHPARTAEMVARLYGREASKDLPEEMLLLKEIRDRFEGIKKYGEAIFSIEKPVGSADAARLMKEMDALGHKTIDGPIGRHRQMGKEDMQKGDDALDEAWRRFLLGSTLGYLAALIVGVAVALIYSSRLASVIKVIHKGSDSIARGDFKTRLDIKTGDELEQLANAMNGMSAQLDSMYANLEQKVEERTRDLQYERDKLRLHAEIERNMAEAVYLIRISDGVIVYTNPFFERLFGYEPGELVGKHVSIVNAPGDKSSEAVANEIISILTQTGVWNGEVHNIRKDGTTFWCHANVLTFEHPQHGRVWLSMHQDITERKKAEEKIKEQLDYLERFQKVAVKREFRVKELMDKVEELKTEIEELKKK